MAVHPRRYGELGFIGGHYFAPFGSSPQVRGTQQHQDDDGVYSRFIPAGTGNSLNIHD